MNPVYETAKESLMYRTVFWHKFIMLVCCVLSCYCCVTLQKKKEIIVYSSAYFLPLAVVNPL